MKKYSKKKNQLKYRGAPNGYIVILKIDMTEENISQEFKMKKIEETRIISLKK